MQGFGDGRPRSIVGSRCCRDTAGGATDKHFSHRGRGFTQVIGLGAVAR